MPKAPHDGGFKLTPEMHKGIVAMIGAGAFPHVAAEANGLSRRTFYQYMSDDYEERYHADHHAALAAFQEDVRSAAARARGAAEIAVRKAKPLEWLRYGPGRDKGKDNPGWTETSKVEVTGANGGPILAAVAAVDLSTLSGDDLNGLESIAAKLAGGRAASGQGGEG